MREEGGLVCSTNFPDCCESERGNWYHPNGSVVMTEGVLYIRRGDRRISLQLSSGAPPGTSGLYCCIMPTDGGIDTMTMCIFLGMRLLRNFTNFHSIYCHSCFWRGPSLWVSFEWQHWCCGRGSGGGFSVSDCHSDWCCPGNLPGAQTQKERKNVSWFLITLACLGKPHTGMQLAIVS